ncbi:MAG TPA: wax ester/triacylglycerol synthase family O-acyltransferase [Acidimicrobiales bacterium]|nr:wax ester/triacylglycerol synthase family O-acyltransferase [Acidimicrobiales bacterium]
MTRVSGIDVMMLYAETPSWQMHVSGLMIADPSTAPDGFDAGVFRSGAAERLASLPPFRWKVREVALGLDHPVLVDEGDFDFDRHFHHVSLPGPGSPRQLGGLVGALMSKPLDRSLPLWEMWLIEGLQGGRVAVLTKIHHALIDGASGVDLTSLLLDVEPSPSGHPLPSFPPPDPPPSAISSALRATANLMATPLRLGRYATQVVEQGAVAGYHLLRGSNVGLPFRTGRSALNGPITSAREFAYVDLPLSDVRAVRVAHRVKVNDVILAAVAGSLRAYLLERGGLPSRPLVAEMPVNMRSEKNRMDIGTRVANTFVSLATDIEDPVERLRAIHRSSIDAKQVQHDVGARKHLDLSDVLPPLLTGAALRAYSRSGLESLVPPIYSLIVSNVRGPDFDLYLGGAKVVGIYPMGPLLYASGLNITALTLGDRIHLGLVACPDRVPDPWSVAELLPKALDELAADASQPA